MDVMKIILSTFIVSITILAITFISALILNAIRNKKYKVFKEKICETIEDNLFLEIVMGSSVMFACITIFLYLIGVVYKFI